MNTTDTDLRAGTFGPPSNNAAAWVWPGEERTEDDYADSLDIYNMSDWRTDYFPDAVDGILHDVLGRWDYHRGLYGLYHRVVDTTRALELGRDNRARYIASMWLSGDNFREGYAEGHADGYGHGTEDRLCRLAIGFGASLMLNAVTERMRKPS